MKREIDYNGIRQAMVYYLDSRDENIIEKAFQAFIFVYNNENELDKLLPSVITPGGNKFFGKELKIEKDRVFVDGIEVVNPDVIQYSGKVVINNNSVGARPIHLHGDFHGDIKAENLHCDSIFESIINVGNIHADDLNSCPLIHAGGKINCDNINKAENITAGEKIEAENVTAQNITGQIKADSVRYEKWQEK